MSTDVKEEELKTAGELERQLTQGIRTLHLSQLGHAPQKISCHLFGNQLAVVMEGSFLTVEQLFLHNEYPELAESVRATIDELLRPSLVEVIETTLKVNVNTVLSNSCSESKVTGIITMLDKTPAVRNPAAIPKTKLFKKRRLRERENAK